jgi:hypothetical protein
MGELRGGDEEADYGTRRRDAEKDGEGAGHPGSMEGDVAAMPEEVGAGEREEEERVEEQDGGDFVEAADGVGVHHERGDSGEDSEGEERLGDAAMRGGVVAADAGGEPEWQQKDEAHRGEDVDEGHGAMSEEDGVEGGCVGKAGRRGMREQDDGSAKDGCGGDDAEDDQGDPGESVGLGLRGMVRLREMIRLGGMGWLGEHGYLGFGRLLFVIRACVVRGVNDSS